LKEQIPCHCCTKHRSSMGSIYCPQICFWFLSCP